MPAANRFAPRAQRAILGSPDEKLFFLQRDLEAFFAPASTTNFNFIEIFAFASANYGKLQNETNFRGGNRSGIRDNGDFSLAEKYLMYQPLVAMRHQLNHIRVRSLSAKFDTF